MFNNNKNSKSSLNNAFMVSAIAFVLFMGTGFSSTQSFGLDYNGIGDLSAYNGLTQSADCFGLGNDCSEDNRVTNNIPSDGNGNGEEPPIGPLNPQGCALCYTDLTQEQEAALLVALDVETIAEACVAIGELTVDEFIEVLTEVGLSVIEIVALLTCLGIEVDLSG